MRHRADKGKTEPYRVPLVDRLRDRLPLWLLTCLLFAGAAVAGVALGGIVALLLALLRR
jgi:hypothetical protein